MVEGLLKTISTVIQGAFIGRYEDKVENQFYWYIRPQETGNKTDVRWLTLLDSGGLGVKITGLQPISFSALHFSPEDLDPGLTRKLQHTIDIVPQKISSCTLT